MIARYSRPAYPQLGSLLPRPQGLLEPSEEGIRSDLIPRRHHLASARHSGSQARDVHTLFTSV